MIRSQPIAIDGRFVGVAIQSSPQWHFVAVDPALADLHGANFRDPADAARVARQVLIRERQAGPSIAAAPGRPPLPLRALRIARSEHPADA